MVPLLIAVATEIFKTHLIWYLRIVDFVDLLIVAPFYLVMLILLYERLLAGRAPGYLRVLFSASSFVFMYGHAMHVTANAINTFSTEIRDYETILPEDTYALIYFLDEDLSHVLVFAALYCLLAALLMFERFSLPATDLETPLWPPLGLGLIYGASQGFVFVEAGKALLAPILGATLGILWYWSWRRQHSKVHIYRHGPISLFIAALIPAQLIAIGLYGLLIGSFIQPSRLGL